MRYLLFLAVALASFTTGVLSSQLFSRDASVEDMEAVSNLELDQWHRLYEAAFFTRDEVLRDDIVGRLQCMQDDHSLTTRLDRSNFKCVDVNGNRTALRFGEDTVFDKLSKTHLAWSLKNLPFIGSIVDRQFARAYVKSHIPNF